MADEAGTNGAANAAVLDMFGQVLAKIDTLSDKMDTLNTKVSDLDQRISSVETNLMGHLSDHATTTTTYNIVEQARSKLASLTCFNNDYNVIFYGIPPRSGVSIDEAFRSFMVDSLHFKQKEAVETLFSAQSMAGLGPQDKNPPICVSFATEVDAVDVRSKAAKHSKELLKSGINARWTYSSGLRLKEN